jgi:hypothetical protein
VDKKAVAQMILSFSEGSGKRVENLPEGDPLRIKGQEMSDYFTSGVGMLKTVFPNPEIRGLMAMVWDIVGSRIVATAMGPEVPSLTLAAMGPKRSSSCPITGST